jgi:hypothetical protein
MYFITCHFLAKSRQGSMLHDKSYSHFEIVSWSWLHYSKLKVNAKHSSYGTLNLGGKKSKTKDMSCC